MGFLLDEIKKDKKYDSPVWDASYYSKVVKEAFESERRKGQVTFRLIKNNEKIYAVLYIGSPYIRVDRRIKYRLDNNKWIEKGSLTKEELWSKEALISEIIINSNGIIGD